MWKCWLKFSIDISFFDTQNTFYHIVRSLKNAFFIIFTPERQKHFAKVYLDLPEYSGMLLKYIPDYQVKMEKNINQNKVPNFPKFHYLHFSFYPFHICTSYFSWKHFEGSLSVKVTSLK